MRIKHKHVLAVLSFIALVFGSSLTPLLQATTEAASSAGTCEYIAEIHGQHDADTTVTACTDAQYKVILAHKPSGVTKSNYKGFCYILEYAVAEKKYSIIDTVGCTTITINHCNYGGTPPDKCKAKKVTPAPVNNTPPVNTPPPSAPSGVDCSANNPQGFCNTDPAIACSKDNKDTCNSDLVSKYVNPAIDLLSVSFGLFAVVSILIGGISFATSAGDPQQASKAKSRITNTVIAVVCYMFLWAFLQFLIPGGAFR